MPGGSANDTYKGKELEYKQNDGSFHESWLGGNQVSYAVNGNGGGYSSYRVLETSAPENIPLILGGVKNIYIGQDKLMPHLGAMKQHELVFVHREDLLLPVVIDTVQKKPFGQVSEAEWRGAGHDGIDSYIARLGGTVGENHKSVADTLSHENATVVTFHVATAEELRANHIDPNFVADQVRRGRATLQAQNPDAEEKAAQFAVGKGDSENQDAHHAFQEATGMAIANMRDAAHFESRGGRGGRSGPGGGGYG